MSEHSEIVREYVEIRNLLGRSNPEPNMKFKIIFVIENNALYMVNKLSQYKLEVARVQPIFIRVYVPHYGYSYENFSRGLARFINNRMDLKEKDKKARALVLAYNFKETLDLNAGYEP
jgi:hypothetical protein